MASKKSTVSKRLHSQIDSLYQERLKGGQGKYPDYLAMLAHLPFLHDLAIETNAQQVVELGVHSGQSTTAFLAALAKTGGNLWSCDVKMPLQPVKDFVGQGPFWDFQMGRAEDLIDIAPEQADIFLEDVGISFETTLKHLELYGRLVRSGGYILIHDVEVGYMTQAVADYLKVCDHSDYRILGNKFALGVIEVA